MQVKKWLMYLGITYLISLILVGGFTYWEFVSLKEEQKRSLVQQSFQQLDYNTRDYQDLETQLKTTLELLANSRQVSDYLEEPNKNHREQIEDAWFSVVLAQAWFSKIALVGDDGYERVAVHYAADLKKVVSHEHNQKSEAVITYHNSRTNKKMYVSGVELHRLPGTNKDVAVVNIVMPIDDAGKRLGYLVASADLSILSEQLHYASNRSLVPEVLDSNGFYIASHDEHKMFGFLFPSRSISNFSQRYPKVWRNITSTDSGTISQDGQLYIFHQVHFFSGDNIYLLLTFSDEDVLDAMEEDIQTLFSQATLGLASLFLFAFPLAYLGQLYHRRSMESKLARAALHGMSAVMVTDSRLRVVQINQEFEKMSKHSPKDILGRNALKLLSPKHQQLQLHTVAAGLRKEGIWEGELTNIKADGELFTSITRIQRISSTALSSSYYICSFVDISERKELENRLRHLSEHDGLTGCWNRRKFDTELQYQARLAERYPQKYQSCLVLVDIDHFKRINDQYGHDEGDKVIKLVAKILAEQLRDSDFLARIGGEEFGVILPNSSIDQVFSLLERLRIAVSVANEHQLTVSIGATDIQADPNRSYKLADVALYESKTHGRNQVSICASSNDDIA
ncbi:diguanylate cyclase [Vibrio sp. SCSIO 43136]|uniref:diguanylate cyclase n=1 Tax=Vibrio sp. SCSIO 43136 TaxID=2819101 RepID=UPI002075C1A0|nr:diguanylate cyclase [Vibrio sp. SCSIO 43136]USD64934.1 diguanylate cyclase [Vibrio sp. SCSIO 43136]